MIIDEVRPALSGNANLISIRVANCLRLCSLLSPSIRAADQSTLKGLIPSDLLDCLGRFKVWVGNIAAHRKGRSSLDYRLREASEIRDQVIELLSPFEKSLQDTLDILQRRKIPWDEESSGSDSDASSIDEVGEGPITRSPQSTSELQQLLRKWNEIITCLMRLSIAIRNPAPYDQFAQKLGLDLSLYETKDIEHVEEKFRPTSAFSGIPPSIAQRLGGAISRRRHYLKYRQKHQEKLSQGLDDPGNNDGSVVPAESTVASELPDRIKGPVSLSIEDDVESDSGLSQTSYATSNNDEIKLRPPPLPTAGMEGNHFECVVCCRIVAIDNTYAWRKHIFRDLRPYVCSFEHCETADRTYESRHEWFEHEIRVHRKRWQCLPGCEKIFCREEKFRSHLELSHLGPASKHELSATIRACVCPPDWNAQALCNLCGACLPSLKALRSHLGNHQEQLALFALPSNMLFDDTDGESEDEKDSGTIHSDGLDDEDPSTELNSHILDVKPQVQNAESDYPESDENLALFEAGRTMAIARWRYKARDKGDLDLDPHDRVSVINKINTDWWMGRNEGTGEVGLFPQAFVKVVRGEDVAMPAVPAQDLSNKDDLDEVQTDLPGSKSETTSPLVAWSNPSLELAEIIANQAFLYRRADGEQRIRTPSNLLSSDIDDEDEGGRKKSSVHSNDGDNGDLITDSKEGTRNRMPRHRPEDRVVAVESDNAANQAAETAKAEHERLLNKAAEGEILKPDNDIISELRDEAATVDDDDSTKVTTEPDTSKAKPPIKFKDAVGRIFSFPWHICRTWTGMEELIRQAFLQSNALGPHVHEGHYDLVGPDGEIILPQDWEIVVRPNWAISMHMWPMPEPSNPVQDRSPPPSLPSMPRFNQLGVTLPQLVQVADGGKLRLSRLVEQTFSEGREARLEEAETRKKAAGDAAAKAGAKARSNAEDEKAADPKTVENEIEQGAEKKKVKDAEVAKSIAVEKFPMAEAQAHLDKIDDKKRAAAEAAANATPAKMKGDEDVLASLRNLLLAQKEEQLTREAALRRAANARFERRTADKEVIWTSATSDSDLHQPTEEGIAPPQSLPVSAANSTHPSIPLQEPTSLHEALLGHKKQTDDPIARDRAIAEWARKKAEEEDGEKVARKQAIEEYEKRQAEKEKKTKEEMQKAVDDYHAEQKKKEEEMERLIAEYELRKSTGAKIGKQQEKDLIAYLLAKDREQKAKEKEEWETFLLEQKERKEEEREKKAKEKEEWETFLLEQKERKEEEREKKEEELEAMMTARLQESGFTHDQIQAIIRPKNLQSHGLELNRSEDIFGDRSASISNVGGVMDEGTSKEAENRSHSGREILLSVQEDGRKERERVIGEYEAKKRDETSAKLVKQTIERLLNPSDNLLQKDPASSSTDESNPRRVQKHPATFQCTLCPKRFTRAYNLRSHLRTHTDERPFVCSVCGRAFARQQDRKRHESLHSGEKRFVCRGFLKDGNIWGCGRRFARAEALGRHVHSEAGRVCIRPLIEEEKEEREAQGKQFAPMEQLPGIVGTSTFVLPLSLVTQYPALAGFQPGELPVDEQIEEEYSDEEIDSRRSPDADLWEEESARQAPNTASQASSVPMQMNIFAISDGET